MTQLDNPRALILGGASDIGRAVAHRLAKDGYDVALAARNVDRLEADRADISLRYDTNVELREFDVLATERLTEFVDGFVPCPTVVVCVVGTMGEHEVSIRDPEAAAVVMRSNYEGPAQVLGLFANRLEKNGGGTVVGVSSVAGDRGRASNYVYGSAKAGFTAFLSGLRNQMSKSNVHVVTVKPGFVATRMTEDLDLPKALTAQPDEVANAILRAVQDRRDVVYVRRVWWFIMFIIRALPERIFKKTSL